MKKTAKEISAERTARWMRYGTLGQSKYGIAALQRIIDDPTAPPGLRVDAEEVKKHYNNLIRQYRAHLKVKETTNV